MLPFVVIMISIYETRQKWVIVLLFLLLRPPREMIWSDFSANDFTAFLEQPTHEIFQVWTLPLWSVIVSNFQSIPECSFWLRL